MQPRTGNGIVHASTKTSTCQDLLLMHNRAMMEGSAVMKLKDPRMRSKEALSEIRREIAELGTSLGVTFNLSEGANDVLIVATYSPTK